MRRIERKHWQLVGSMFWTIFALLQLRGLDLEPLFHAEFWIIVGRICLSAAVGLVGFAVLSRAYRRFCGWFNRAVDAERARIDARIAAREGLTTWPTTHPLHDPDLDRVAGSPIGHPLNGADRAIRI